MIQISESRIGMQCESTDDYQIGNIKPVVGYVLDSFEEEAEA